MNDIQTKFSIHNSDGWKGQYDRMRRWDKRLEAYNCSITDTNQLHDFLDTLYSTYQNIFHLKDWLNKDNVFDRKTLNDFVNKNTEIGLCRDIANGTKHFTLDKNFSVCNNFLIMSMWDPSNENKYWSDRKIRIMSQAGLFDPFGLSKKCITVWTTWLTEQNVLQPSEQFELEDVNPVYFEPNIQTVFGQRMRRKKNSH